MIGPKAPKKEREEMVKKIKQNPREFVAQPLEILSTIPTISENGIEPRHLDLRPFILNGKSTYVTMGGLTRVALRKGKEVLLLIVHKVEAQKILWLLKPNFLEGV